GLGHLRDKMLDDREAVGRNPIGRLDPEVVEWLAERVDRGDVLHPVNARPAGDDDSRREAVPVWQRLTVHQVGDQGVLVEGLPDGYRLLEIGGAGNDRTVGAVEGDLEGILRKPCLGQDVPDPRALPARIAHRTGTLFDAGNMRVEQ